MPQGGGFCDKHGPYDPPYRACPYCTREQEQRRAYGPPGVEPAQNDDRLPAPDQWAVVEEPDVEFVRATIEPVIEPEPVSAQPEQTEMAPRSQDEPAADAGPIAPLGWLVVKHPADQRGTILPVRANQIVGREGDVQWDDPRLSRQHARFTLEPPAGAPDDPPVFHLWPFGTTNPVFINGQEIRGATPLAENDEIHLGDTLFVFKMLLD